MEDLIRILRVKANVRNIEREFGIARGLGECIVNSQRKIRKARKRVGTGQRAVLALRIGVESTKGQVGNVALVAFDPELEIVFAVNVVDTLGKFPLSFVGPPARETGVAEFEVGWNGKKDRGETRID